MNELIEAAKAVIDAEFVSQQRVAIENLRAAVERAEKPPFDFDEWWGQTEIWPSEYTAAASAWIAAQQAERERIKNIIRYQFGDLVSDLSEVMEMIDSGEE